LEDHPRELAIIGNVIHGYPGNKEIFILPLSFFFFLNPFYFLFYSPSLSLTLNQEYILDIIPCKIFIKVGMTYIKRMIMSGDYPL
jgi:hypothetical protein